MDAGGLRRLVSRAAATLEEARRRHTFRAGAVYAAAAFVALQAADLVLPSLPLPPGAYDLLVALALLGLPVALAAGWAWDLTPVGFRRTDRRTDPGFAALPRVALGVVAAASVAGAVLVAAPLLDEPGERSVAVLPFADLSAERDQAYLADGIAEDVLTHLSRIGGLRVVSRTSVQPYRETDKPVTEIGEELGVAYVLEGSVRRDGDRIRITAQLVDARRDEHLWAQSYDREIHDLFAVQSDIATSIGREMALRLTEDERERIRGAPTADLAAYDEFLRGRDLYHRIRKEANEDAIVLFRSAIARDDSFALAHAWLGAAFAAERHRFGGGATWLDSATVAAERALELDPDLSDAHRVLGTVRMTEGRLREALRSLERAIELNPNDWAATGNLGTVYGRLGRHDDAARAYRRVAEGDPVLAMPVRTNLGVTYTTLGLLDAAETELRAALALAPDNRFPLGALARLELRRGRPDEARALAERIVAGSPEDLGALAVAGELLLTAGADARARELLERVVERSPTAAGGQAAVQLAHLLDRAGEEARAVQLLDLVEEDARSAVDSGTEYHAARVILAAAAAVRGEEGEAIRWLREAVRLGYRDAVGLATDPVFVRLRSTPGFRAIVADLEERVARSRAGLTPERASPRTKAPSRSTPATVSLRARVDQRSTAPEAREEIGELLERFQTPALETPGEDETAEDRQGGAHQGLRHVSLLELVGEDPEPHGRHARPERRVAQVAPPGEVQPGTAPTAPPNLVELGEPHAGIGRDRGQHAAIARTLEAIQPRPGPGQLRRGEQRDPDRLSLGVEPEGRVAELGAPPLLDAAAPDDPVRPLPLEVGHPTVVGLAGGQAAVDGQPPVGTLELGRPCEVVGERRGSRSSVTVERPGELPRPLEMHVGRQVRTPRAAIRRE